MIKKDILWFKKEIAPILKNYELTYAFFKEGDVENFGSLNRVEFDSKRLCGSIQFWNSGWLDILIWDDEQEKELLNILLSPEEDKKKEKCISTFIKILAPHVNRSL